MATSASDKSHGGGAGRAKKGQHAPAGPPPGAPLPLEIELIDEDPDQPRTEENPGFSSSRLAELAATIRARGVKTPISVRENPQAPGRYLINHGARRLRASKLAGARAIPGFIDNDYSDADQVIENLQRNELTPREIADYIGRQLAKGFKKAEIAKSIGKSAAFVTQHVTLLDLPQPIAQAFAIGRARDVTVISELVKAYKTDRAAVSDWLSDETQEITRGAVAMLREYLSDKDAHGSISALYDESENDGSVAPLDEEEAVDASSSSAAARPRGLVLHVTYKKREAVMLLQRRPSAENKAWIRFEQDATELEVDVADLRMVALRERV